jgi:RTX calcium-binding nonapeptide repeat (4 copies)
VLDSGNDLTRGGDGNDEIWDGRGADTLHGDLGNDILIGQSTEDPSDAADVLFGGFGDDELYGDDGDTLEGGGGLDFFGIYVDDAGDDPVLVPDVGNNEDVYVGWNEDLLGPLADDDIEIVEDAMAEEIRVYMQEMLVAIIRGDVNPDRIFIERLGEGETV